MRQISKRLVMYVVILNLFFTACGANQVSHTPPVSNSRSTSTSIPLETPILTITSTPVPTAIGGLSGFVLFTNEHFEYAMDGQEVQSESGADH